MIGDEFARVLHAAQSGDAWAFSSLYRDLNAPLLRYFGAHVPSEAEDLVAETWLSVARGLGSFSGDEAGFRGWIFTIAHRRLVQYWRDSARRPTSPVAPESLLDRPGPDDTEETALQGSLASTAARKIAAALPREQAHVVLLRVVAGLSVEQVAEILGKRPGTVRVLQHKALRRLAGRFSLEKVTH